MRLYTESQRFSLRHPTLQYLLHHDRELALHSQGFHLYENRQFTAEDSELPFYDLLRQLVERVKARSPGLSRRISEFVARFRLRAATSSQPRPTSTLQFGQKLQC